MACLLAGYCKLMVDPTINVFRWGPRPKMRRIPAEEGTTQPCEDLNHMSSIFINAFNWKCLLCAGYISRCGSDSEDSSEDDYVMEGLLDAQLSEDTMSNQTNDGTEEGDEDELDLRTEAARVRVIVTHPCLEDEGEEAGKSESVADEDYSVTVDTLLETGWYTDPRVNSSFSSLSSNSLNALEESIKAAIGGMDHKDAPREEKFSSDRSDLDVHHPYLLEVPERVNQRGNLNKPVRPSQLTYNDRAGLRFADLSQMSDSLPSPPAASDDALSDDDDEEEDRDNDASSMSAEFEAVLASCSANSINAKLAGVNFQELFSRIHRQERASNNQTEPKQQRQLKTTARAAAVRSDTSNVKDSRGSGSESEEEFYDAQDRFTPPITEKRTTGL